MNRFWAVLFVFVFTLVSVSAASMLAQGPAKDSKSNKTATVSDNTTTVPKDLKEYAERAQKSADVLNEVMGVPEKGIPQDLMDWRTIRQRPRVPANAEWELEHAGFC
jgi:LAS superfamily LD-carboxypeptidase LdcB